MEDIDSYSKEHVIKICRERCIEVSVYSSELDTCMKRCIESTLGGKDSN